VILPKSELPAVVVGVEGSADFAPNTGWDVVCPVEKEVLFSVVVLPKSGFSLVLVKVELPKEDCEVLVLPKREGLGVVLGLFPSGEVCIESVPKRLWLFGVPKGVDWPKIEGFSAFVWPKILDAGAALVLVCPKILPVEVVVAGVD